MNFFHCSEFLKNKLAVSITALASQPVIQSDTRRLECLPEHPVSLIPTQSTFLRIHSRKSHYPAMNLNLFSETSVSPTNHRKVCIFPHSLIPLWLSVVPSPAGLWSTNGGGFQRDRRLLSIHLLF